MAVGHQEQPSHLFTGVDEQRTSPTNVRVGDLCVFRRVDSEDKFLLGRVIQFSYLTGNKRQCEYSSSYVDMSIPSYANIGVYCNYFARCSDSIVQGAIRFKPLNQVFTAGYLPMDHYVAKVNEDNVVGSDDPEVPFEIDSACLDSLVESVDSLSVVSEFIS